MARKVIKESDFNILYHHTGFSKFRGCQCFKDCTCHEDFKGGEYNFYSVKRKGRKTTFHKNLEEAENRYYFLEEINKFKNK